MSALGISGRDLANRYFAFPFLCIGIWRRHLEGGVWHELQPQRVFPFGPFGRTSSAVALRFQPARYRANRTVASYADRSGFADRPVIRDRADE